MSETECRRGFCLKGNKHLNGAGWCNHMAMDEHSNAYFVGIDELPDPVPRQRGLAERQPGPPPEVELPQPTVGQIMRRYRAALGKPEGHWANEP